MARNPTEQQPAPKTKGPIGAFRVDGGRFASYDAQGRTEVIDEATALEIGIKEA